MKRWLLIVFLMSSVISNGQFLKGDHSLGLGYTSFNYEQYFTQEISLQYQHQFSHRILGTYTFGVQHMPDNDEWMYHFTGGPMVTGLLFYYLPDWTYSFESALSGIGVALTMAILPEKVTYCFYGLDNHLQIGPYVQYMSFDYYKHEGGFIENIFYRCGAGFDLRFVDQSERLVISATGGVQYIPKVATGYILGVRALIRMNKNMPSRQKIETPIDLGYD